MRTQLGRRPSRLTTPPRGVIPASSKRRLRSALSHSAPRGRRLGRKRALLGTPRLKGNLDTFPGRWPGTSREHEPARRRARNRRSWAKLQRDARSYFLGMAATRRVAAADPNADALSYGGEI
jgi:hypothetical protein